MINTPVVFLLAISSLAFLACEAPVHETDRSANTEEAEIVIQRLLTAIENRDLNGVEATMSPSGELELINPGRETSYSLDAFMDLHRGWFKDTTWTIETEILTSVAGKDLAAVSTSAMYRETNRDGVPYFNRMIVSYVLEKQDGAWKVIKDHASSIEKSTDAD